MELLPDILHTKVLCVLVPDVCVCASQHSNVDENVGNVVNPIFDFVVLS